MRLITIFELAVKKDVELKVLFRHVTDAVTQSMPDTADRRNALASLQNIIRTMSGPKR
ncbi:MAG: hypothetical protein QM808_17745 [Steroidobacteraceae bacterium]